MITVLGPWPWYTNPGSLASRVRALTMDKTLGILIVSSLIAAAIVALYAVLASSPPPAGDHGPEAGVVEE
jgi:hypothetical protein